MRRSAAASKHDGGAWRPGGHVARQILDSIAKSGGIERYSASLLDSLVTKRGKPCGKLRTFADVCTAARAGMIRPTCAAVMTHLIDRGDLLEETCVRGGETIPAYRRAIQ